MMGSSMEVIMTADGRYVLKAIRDDNPALAGGYEAEQARLHAMKLILWSASGWVITEEGRQALELDHAAVG